MSFSQLNPTGIPSIISIVSLRSKDSYLFLGLYDSCLYRSSDFGYSWSKCTYGLFPHYSYVHLVSTDSAVYAWVPNGSNVYKSTNYGNSWSTFYNGTINYFTVKEPYAFVGTNNGSRRTTNNGQTWNSIPEFAYSNANFCISNNYAIAVSNTLFRSKMYNLTNVENNSVPVNNYKLYQNYPNPFNPNTIIRFQIPTPENGKWKIENSITVLKVYDILGKEIATLVNEKLKPGSYEIPFSINQFSNNQLPSGIYFYKLVTGNYSESKRMILLK